MRYRSTTSWLAVVLGLVFCPLLAQSQPERLVVGEQKTFRPGYAVGDIAISNPSVCDFRVVSGRREVMLIANGLGYATLTIWDQRGAKRDEIGIEVLSREFAKTLMDLGELLRPYPDVVIRPLGDRAVVAGTVNTLDELQNVRTLAGASPNTVCTVTVRTTAPPPAAGVTGPPVHVVQPPATAPPAVPTIVRDPEPPPPVRRAPVVVPGPPPVPLGQTPPATAVPVSADPVTPPPAQPVAIPAPPVPPPPNMSPATPDRTGAPAPAGTSDANAPIGTGSVEYLFELYESPAAAPPPEVAGPQGRRLFSGRLRTDPGIEIRHLVQVPLSQSVATAQPRGLSIGLTPTVRDSAIQTSVVVDTNLPVGAADPRAAPVWIRSALTFASRPGQTRYIQEFELAQSARPAAGSNARTQSKARATTLLIVLTPSFARAPTDQASIVGFTGDQVHGSRR